MERRGVPRKTHDKTVLQRIGIRYLTEPGATLKSLATEYGLPVRTLYYHLQRRHFHLPEFKRLYACDAVTVVGNSLVGLNRQKVLIEDRFKFAFVQTGDIFSIFYA